MMKRTTFSSLTEQRSVIWETSLIIWSGGEICPLSSSTLTSWMRVTLLRTIREPLLENQLEPILNRLGVAYTRSYACAGG